MGLKRASIDPLIPIGLVIIFCHSRPAETYGGAVEVSRLDGTRGSTLAWHHLRQALLASAVEVPGRRSNEGVACIHINLVEIIE